MKQSQKTTPLITLELTLGNVIRIIESRECWLHDVCRNEAMDEIISHLENMREYKSVLSEYINYRKQQVVLKRP